MRETFSLFKYLSPDKLVFFENQLVQLTPPIYLNDPWDFLPKGRIPSEVEINRVWLEVERNVAQSSVLQLTVQSPLREQQERLEKFRADLASKECLADQGRDYQNEIGKIVGIVSLTEQPLNRSMWAHYADSHKGFVAEFAAGNEGTAHGLTIRMCALGPVAAAKVKYHPDFQEISQNADNVQKICWSKHPDWVGEQEWRIVWPLQRSLTCTLRYANRDEQIKRFCLPFAAQGLQRVIFGMRMEAGLKQRLCAMLARNGFDHVQKQVTDIDPHTGEMVLKPLAAL